MADDNQATSGVDKDAGDGWADAIAVTAIMAIVITTIIYWLGGFPG